MFRIKNGKHKVLHITYINNNNNIMLYEYMSNKIDYIHFHYVPMCISRNLAIKIQENILRTKIFYVTKYIIR